MTTPNRPKRVVVVDAENPLVEVQGEFFWREDHEAIVSGVREEAYRAGYQSGWADAARAAAQAGPQVIEFRRRRSMVGRVRRIVVVFVLISAFLIFSGTVIGNLLAER